MIEVPIWFYWLMVVGDFVVLLLILFKLFIYKKANHNTQNHPNNNKPLIMENTQSDTTKNKGGKDTNYDTPKHIH